MTLPGPVACLSFYVIAWTSTSVTANFGREPPKVLLFDNRKMLGELGRECKVDGSCLEPNAKCMIAVPQSGSEPSSPGPRCFCDPPFVPRVLSIEPLTIKAPMCFVPGKRPCQAGFLAARIKPFDLLTDLTAFMTDLNIKSASGLTDAKSIAIVAGMIQLNDSGMIGQTEEAWSCLSGNCVTIDIDKRPMARDKWICLDLDGVVNPLVEGDDLKYHPITTTLAPETTESSTGLRKLDTSLFVISGFTLALIVRQQCFEL